MATMTYEELQTENLVTFSFSALTSNFKTVDSFIKNFSHFQRKFNDMEKIQKATAHDLSNFKMSTTNTFSTMNEVLDSRGSISKGNNKAMEEDMVEVKKNVKELKLFITESTRDLNATLENKEKQTAEVYKKYDSKLAELTTYHESNKLRIQSLESEIYQIKSKYTPRTETEIVKENLSKARQNIEETREELNATKDLLQNLGVEEFKQTLDKIEKELNDDMSNLKIKFKLKTDISDTLKLEDMLLNLVNFSYENVAKKYANKIETKKALIYLEKKINAIIQSSHADEDADKDRDGLVAAKGWKCISCTKDLGDYEGKIDKYKVWTGFPTKDPNTKDKYGGFGTGFQNIVETVVTRKGGEVGYDEKGKMTAPFNLTREGQAPALKHSMSQRRVNDSRNSPTKQPTESNYMNLFGRNSQMDIDLRAEYLQKEKGLSSTIKVSAEDSRLKT